MRWVTRNPPKTLTLASTTAAKPRTVPQSIGCGPAASMAPTMMMPEMALVTDMSGVCSAGVTVHTT